MVDQTPNTPNTPKRPRGDIMIFCICIALVIVMMQLSVKVMRQRYMDMSCTYSYTEFMQHVADEKIKTAEISESAITGETKDGMLYFVDRVEDEKLTERLLAGNVDITSSSAGDTMKQIGMVANLTLTAFMIYYLYRMMHRGGVLGKSNKIKKFDKEKATVKFADVAGQDEAKDSLLEIVDFLQNKEKYAAVGAKLPKGALLVGPPGTGKTLLAKAVAGEAEVPFYSMSGSDFVEMFVGMGASRVRSLFEAAKKDAPCIIFIDEIDAIAGARTSSGNSEREQTLNQLLTEMDGFATDAGIVVLGATNRPESLDPAILRPGRFDRRIVVELPDVMGREAILAVHSRGLKFDETVNLKELALQTAGVSGADLAGIMNEAAIAAVKDGRLFVSQKDLIASIESVLVGKEKKTRLLNEKEKKIVACHEIGHALAAVKLTGSKPVQKISIVPRTMGALGFVMQAPTEETYLRSKAELENEMAVLLAGRAAEEVFFNEITTGDANDLEKATGIARDMVTRFGFGQDLTTIAKMQNMYLRAETTYTCSPQTMYLADQQIADLLETAYDKAVAILKQNSTLHHKLTEHLLEHESIIGQEFQEILDREQAV
ncbi:ATP-dependent zinc metalloprotease FtsH [Clostridium porci]|nr:ATP-dependent zinc metalloprotease FtsH [Clostridium porci]